MTVITTSRSNQAVSFGARSPDTGDSRATNHNRNRGRSEGWACEPGRQNGKDRVKSAFYRLPLRTRAVLLLHVHDRLPFQTIAELLQLTPAAARERYSRALELLRPSLRLEGARP